MVRYTGPKNRIARRFGANIFGRARNPLLHKPNPPGVHGAKKKKKSDFGLQLEEQQKLKAVYGMLTRAQLVRYYQRSDALQRQYPCSFSSSASSAAWTISSTGSNSPLRFLQRSSSSPMDMCSSMAKKSTAALSL